MGLERPDRKPEPTEEIIKGSSLKERFAKIGSKARVARMDETTRARAAAKVEKYGSLLKILRGEKDGSSKPKELPKGAKAFLAQAAEARDQMLASSADTRAKFEASLPKTPEDTRVAEKGKTETPPSEKPAA